MNWHTHCRSWLVPLLVLVACIAPWAYPAPLTVAAGGAASAAMQQQWRIVSRPGIEIDVHGSGLYCVSASVLRRAGLRSGANPRTLALYTGGRPSPMVVRHTSSFASDGAIEFYGRGLSTPETGTRAYWLVAGVQAGIRIPAVDAHAALAVPRGDFSAVSTITPHQNYFPLALNGSRSNIFGPLVSATSPASATISAPGLDSAGAGASLLVTLQGVSLGAHDAAVELNSHALGTVTLADRTQGSASFPIEPAWLRRTGNTVRLSAASPDSMLLAAIRLTYPHAFRLTGQSLHIPAAAGATVRVAAPATAQILDVTDPGRPIILRPAVGSTRAGKTLAVRVPAAPAGTHTILVAAQPTALAAADVHATRPSAWHTAGHRADLLIIGYRPFLPAIQPLVRLREREGLRVAVVPVDAVYDEFGFGEHGPAPVRNFLEWAHTHWSTPPRYVLLLGSASYDPRRELGKANLDLVPTRLIDTVTMETASDEWFVDFKNDGRPQMALGRLPARTLAEAQTMVAKITGYQPPPLSAVLIADSPAAPTDFDFGAAARQLGSVFPASAEVSTLLSDSTGTGLHGRIAAAMNAGPRFVDYLGHGNVDRWSRNDFFDNAGAAELTNASRLSTDIMMTCLTGYFIAPTLHSLGETLLDDKAGGAVAVWASTGETVAESQTELNAAFYAQLFAHPGMRLGDAILAAAQTVRDEQVRRTWVLLGDPTLPGTGSPAP